MFLVSVIANFVFVFVLSCVFVRPKFKHVMISLSYVVPYLFIIWYFLLKNHPDTTGQPAITVIAMLVLSFVALMNYVGRRSKDLNGLTFSYVIFMFLYWSPVLILLPHLTK